MMTNNTPRWLRPNDMHRDRRRLLWCIVACALLFMYHLPIRVSLDAAIPRFICPEKSVSWFLNQDIALEWIFDVKRDADNPGLTEEQCSIAFPDLYKPIEDNVRRLSRSISQQDLETVNKRKEVRVLIWNNAVYILEDWPDDLVPNRKFATLLAIQRALLAVSSTGERFPNIEFLFGFADKAGDESRPIWAYDRTIGTTSVWLMPDFGLYSWPAHGVGSYAEVRHKMREMEANIEGGFTGKLAKLVWRGTVDFGIEVRQALLDAAQGRSWSAVEKLDWYSEDSAEHTISMPDHCKYKYLAHTEGLAYSGRLKYLHNCESVIVAHEPVYETHDQHLWRTSGPEQNIVTVSANFSDLNKQMSILLTHPADSERIARNNVATFRDRYLTPAAEGCYWRQMVREWGRNSFTPEFYEEIAMNETENGKQNPTGRRWRGTPLETFLLTRSLQWDLRHVG